jgi:hypothetical protein
MPNIDVDVKKKVLWKQKNNIIVLCGNFEFRVETALDIASQFKSEKIEKILLQRKKK